MFKILSLDVSSIDYNFKSYFVLLEDFEYENYYNLGVNHIPTIGIFWNGFKYIFYKNSDLFHYKKYTIDIIKNHLNKYKGLTDNSFLYCNLEKNNLAHLRKLKLLLIDKLILNTKEKEICDKYKLKNNEIILRINDKLIHFNSNEAINYDNLFKIYFVNLYNKNLLSYETIIKIKIYQFPFIILHKKHKKYIKKIKNLTNNKINIFYFNDNLFKTFYEFFIEIQVRKNLKGILYVDLKNNIKYSLKDDLNDKNLDVFCQNILLGNKMELFFYTSNLSIGNYLFKNLNSSNYYTIVNEKLNKNRIILFYFSEYDKRSAAFAKQLSNFKLNKKYEELEFYKIDLLHNEVKGINQDPKLICYKKNHNRYDLFVSYIWWKDIKIFIKDCTGIDLNENKKTEL